jgi:hypothetical protein
MSEKTDEKVQKEWKITMLRYTLLIIISKKEEAGIRVGEFLVDT